MPLLRHPSQLRGSDLGARSSRALVRASDPRVESQLEFLLEDRRRDRASGQNMIPTPRGSLVMEGRAGPRPRAARLRRRRRRRRRAPAALTADFGADVQFGRAPPARRLPATLSSGGVTGLDLGLRRRHDLRANGTRSHEYAAEGPLRRDADGVAAAGTTATLARRAGSGPHAGPERHRVRA